MRSEIDQELLELVFRDFLEEHRGDYDGLIVHLGRVPSEAQIRQDTRDEDWDRIRPLLQIMRAEAEGQEALPFRSFSDRRIVVRSRDPRFAAEYLEGVASKQPCRIATSLPALAADRRSALVRFTFNGGDHGASATYLLETKAGSWAIRWRKLAYYL